MGKKGVIDILSQISKNPSDMWWLSIGEAFEIGLRPIKEYESMTTDQDVDVQKFHSNNVDDFKFNT